MVARLGGQPSTCPCVTVGSCDETPGSLGPAEVDVGSGVELAQVVETAGTCSRAE